MGKDGAAIQIEGLEKGFKDVTVLKGIDLCVERGSIFALLGSNGAGKTTTIKILSTLLRPDRGRAEVCGFDVVKNPEKVRECISLTGQYAAVDEIMTGSENMRMIGLLRHMPDVNEQADKLMRVFGLDEAANRRVSTYSGGMLRKLDIAMSILGAPQVIFLDEPTTGLDPQSRYSMWSIIKTMAELGVTIFLTTQYLDEAEYLADRIAILNGGKIIASGTQQELKKLLPQGVIEISFLSLPDLERTCNILEEVLLSYDKDMMTITISVGGQANKFMEIFRLLDSAGIEISEFVQKIPSLEDVFMTLIGVKQEGGFQ